MPTYSARSLSALAALMLAGCVHIPEHRSLAAPTPRFDAIAFFLGSTAGEGVIRIKHDPERSVRVTGRGHMDGDTLILDQHVEQQGGTAKNRQWRLRATGPNGWTGTLTDAAGPVVATTTGNTLAIRYRIRGGLTVRQWIALQPGGQVALNRMAVFKFGLPVARLTETIRRVD